MLKPIVKKHLAINTSYLKYIQQQLEDQNNILQLRQRQNALKACTGPQSVRESCGHLHGQINNNDDMAYNTCS